jgi:hypothetical protein
MDHITDLEQADEEILSPTLSDELLETAGTGQYRTLTGSTGNMLPDTCCSG